ncbi:Cof-type HAD-IIB family hydrolase [Lacrimispora algidixylanolytica]|uniref:Cof-type HAD-IIB family hydrolase n=1 Tax=Lacrimispora algidixylanolytica TaxID=94868 RepID=UPI001A9BB404|nr:HAD family hydrolase [Lacrimispora algidixylanolytica]
MKPIVSFDVDMTLLDHKDWTIPDSAMEAIEQLRENYTIVLATGRDMDSIFSTAIRDRVKPDAIIHLNGTKVTVGDEIIFEHTFDKSLLKQILKYTEKTPYSVGTTVEDFDYYINPEGVKAHDICLWGQSSRKFNDPYKLLELNVRTMAYMGDETGAKAMEEEFPEIHVHMFADKKGADVVERKASKAVGLLRLCDYYKIPLSETIAFGDSMNDYDIIKVAGKGIAMGNAMEELKKAADYVTDPIDQDGIRNACLHFGLIR